MRRRIKLASTGGLPSPENSVSRNDVMKTAKTKTPARKAEKMSRPSGNTKASAKTPTRTPAKLASAKVKVARPVEVVKSSSKAAPRAAEKPIVTTPRDALTLPLKPAPIITAPIPAPTAVPPTPAATTTKPVSRPVLRADVPPEAGFTLQVDGHFKNQFETLAQAKQAATDLKSRFPILRIEIYDAAKKARLPI
jgi:hypothetical protein